MKGVVVLFFLAAATCVRADNLLLDGIIKNLLEGLRDDLKSFNVSDIYIPVNASGVSGQWNSTEMKATNLDTFDIVKLETVLLPLSLKNLTLSWKNISITCDYELIADVESDFLQGPVSIDGVGLALLELHDVSVELGATFFYHEKHLQVKNITTLSAKLPSALVNLSNLFEDSDMTLVINTLLSFLLPNIVEDEGDKIMETIKPILLELINQKLMGEDPGFLSRSQY